MSDINLVPLEVDDTVRGRIFVTVDGEEVQYSLEEVGISFDESEADIMNKIAPLIQEAKGVDITDSFKVRKMTNNENIFVIPSSVAGGYSKCPSCGYYAFDGTVCFDCGYRK